VSAYLKIKFRCVPKFKQCYYLHINRTAEDVQSTVLHDRRLLISVDNTNVNFIDEI
jgi:hypothetical protein